jgi:hypothetical protein
MLRLISVYSRGWLGKTIKRWKTDNGYVYVLAGGRKDNGKDTGES